MRRFLFLIGVMSIVLMFIGCQGISNDTTPPVLSEMSLEEERSEGDDPNEAIAIYSVENEKYETFLEKYEEQLLKEGWKIVLDGKPDFLSVEKEEVVLKVMPIDTEEGLQVQLFEEIKEE